MAVFKCKMCGGALEVAGGESVAVCEYCGTKQTLPKLEDEKRANLYDRANHFRRNNDFDKAMGIYEQILNEDTTDAEAYWSLVLCRYGIEYVEDPASHMRVPTVNRAQFTSILADEDYKAALQYSDSFQKEVYEAEASTIDKIQKGILEISQKEEPFDVFICYKETDNNGRRTPDSVLANDLFHQLTQEGFKVFFARITLEDKLGAAYEPYIFAALNSAKVMVVLGTKPEYFSAIWVKNEWSRYLSLIRHGAPKVLIPAYRDMDPYDLPEEFSHLQAQDMSKLGFMQDLIRGIRKLIAAEEKNVQKQVVVTNSREGTTGIEPLLKRVFLYLEDGNWTSADEYCEKVLDMDPECAQGYLGKMMAELQIRTESEIEEYKDEKIIKNHPYYLKACRFADDKYRSVLEGYITAILNRKEREKAEEERRKKEDIYLTAMDWIKAVNPDAKLFYENYFRAAKLLEQIPDYKDAKLKKEECLELGKREREKSIYEEAQKLLASKANLSLEIQLELFTKAKNLFDGISEYEDAGTKIEECTKRIQGIKNEMIYQNALISEESVSNNVSGMQIEKLYNAINLYEQISGYKDATERKEQCLIKIRHLEEKLSKTKVWVIMAVIALSIISLICYYFIIPAIKYGSATKLLEDKNYLEAYNAFDRMDGYRDSEKQKEKIYSILYDEAIALFENGEYRAAADCFALLTGYKNSGNQGATPWSWFKYSDAHQLMEDKAYEEATELFRTLGSFQDSETKAQEALTQQCYAEAERSLAQGGYDDYYAAISLYAKIGDTEKVKDTKIQLALYCEEHGKYKEAIKLYGEIKNVGYRVKICEIACQGAKKYIAQNKYEEAFYILEEVEWHLIKDDSMRLSYLELYDKCSAQRASMASEGSIVNFGRYPQTVYGDEEPITWVVVEKNENKTLLVSEYALVFRSYDDKGGYCHWPESDLRDYLNSEFYNNAFFYNECIIETVNEQNMGSQQSKDKVFILSANEMKEKLVKYGADVYESKPTVWVRSHMTNSEDWKFEGNFILWTRGVFLYGKEDNVRYIDDYGYIVQVGPDAQNGWALVRPAIWIVTE